MSLPIPDVCDLNRYAAEQAIATARQRLLERPTYDQQISSFLNEYVSLAQIDIRVVERAFDILTEICPPARLFTVLRSAMENDRPEVRSKAALTLGRKVESLQLLQKLVSDPDPRVRANTVEALWGRRTPDIEGVFRKALADAHHRVVANAAYGLYVIGDSNHAERLEALVTHKAPGQRAAAAWLIGKIGDVANGKLLRPLLVDQQESVRKAAFQAVTAMRNSKPNPAEAA